MTGDLFGDFAAELEAAPPAPPPPPPAAPIGDLAPVAMPAHAPPPDRGDPVPADVRIPVAFACHCGGRREVQQPAPATMPCPWCKVGVMAPYVPRFAPPPGAGEPSPGPGPGR